MCFSYEKKGKYVTFVPRLAYDKQEITQSGPYSTERMGGARGRSGNEAETDPSLGFRGFKEKQSKASAREPAKRSVGRVCRNT